MILLMEYEVKTEVGDEDYLSVVRYNNTAVTSIDCRSL